MNTKEQELQAAMARFDELFIEYPNANACRVVVAAVRKLQEANRVLREHIDSISIASGFPIVEDRAQVTETIIIRIKRVDDARDRLAAELAEEKKKVIKAVREAVDQYVVKDQQLAAAQKHIEKLEITLRGVENAKNVYYEQCKQAEAERDALRAQVEATCKARLQVEEGHAPKGAGQG
jgi:uncharacterized protein (UPF0210 family)